MSHKPKYAVETVSLTKAFKDWWGRTKVLAVQDLDLKIEHNEVYGLLGPNGSGKSTTIKMLLSLLRPTNGVAFVMGGQASDTAISSKIGFLPEESYLYKYLSARETLRFYGNLFGLPSRVMDMRIDALLDMVGLSAVANRPVGTFSKGMARRIGLAQALINDPDLLILDEPTSGLDPIGTRQIKDLIKSLANRGKTILMCSHLLADVEDVCDRIGILYGGKMQQEGHVSELLKRTGTNQMTTSVLSATAIKKIKEIVEKEHSSFEVTQPMDKLEDMFMRIVNDAQKGNQQTSGAFSTTKIGDFLSSAPQEGKELLDSLVSAEVEMPSEKPSLSTMTEQTERVEKLEKVETVEAPKTEVLEGLTGVVEADQAKEMLEESTVTEPVKKEDVEKVNKDLLNDLLKGPNVDMPSKAKEITEDDDA